MRRPGKSSFLKRILLIAMVGVAVNIHAGENQDGSSVLPATQQEWVCDYIRSGDVLYLRCDDMASLLIDPLIMDEAEDSSTQFIPIWRQPIDEASAVRLVEAVLCKQGYECKVQMKSLFSDDKLVNR